MSRESKNSTYKGYTESLKKSNAKFHEVKVKMLPKRHEMVKNA